MLSIFFYIVLLLFSLSYFVMFSIVFVLTVPFDRNRAVLHWFSRVWTKGYFALTPTCKVIVEGRENIVLDTPYVVIVNHRSMIDIILMYALPFNFKWVAKKEVYKWPLFGWVLWMHGDITIERGKASGVKKMVAEGREWLGRGVSVIIFPEGSRGKGESVSTFKEGGFLLAKSSGVGILPCAAIGTSTTFKGWKINFRNTYKLRILEPLTPEYVASKTTKQLAAEMQELIAGEYQKLKEEVIK